MWLNSVSTGSFRVGVCVCVWVWVCVCVCVVRFLFISFFLLWKVSSALKANSLCCWISVLGSCILNSVVDTLQACRYCTCSWLCGSVWSVSCVPVYLFVSSSSSVSSGLSSSLDFVAIHVVFLHARQFGLFPLDDINLSLSLFTTLKYPCETPANQLSLFLQISGRSPRHQDGQPPLGPTSLLHCPPNLCHHLAWPAPLPRPTWPSNCYSLRLASCCLWQQVWAAPHPCWVLVYRGSHHPPGRSRERMGQPRPLETW